MAVYKEETNVQNILGEAGKAKIKFNCAPQRWLKSGEDFVRITVDDLENVTNGMETLVNPTFNISNPLIKVKAVQGGESGFITVANSKDVYTVYIGYKVFLDRGITEYTIDCQNHDTYCRYNQNEGNKLQEAIDSMNSVSYGTYPTFSPGNNSIVFSGFDYIEIQPRWWIV
jgi:phage-related protein